MLVEEVIYCIKKARPLFGPALNRVVGIGSERIPDSKGNLATAQRFLGEAKPGRTHTAVYPIPDHMVEDVEYLGAKLNPMVLVDRGLFENAQVRGNGRGAFHRPVFRVAQQYLAGEFGIRSWNTEGGYIHPGSIIANIPRAGLSPGL